MKNQSILSIATLLLCTSQSVYSSAINYSFTGEINTVPSNFSSFFNTTQQLSGSFEVNNLDANNAPSTGLYNIEYVDVTVGSYSGAAAPFSPNQDFITIENNLNGVDRININASTIMTGSIFADGGEYIPQILWFDISDTTGSSLTGDALVTGDILSMFSGSIATSNWGLEYMCVSGPCMFDSALVSGSITSLAGATVPVPAAVWLFVSGVIGLIGIARRKKTYK